jgi:hypothetical protein
MYYTAWRKDLQENSGFRKTTFPFLKVSRAFVDALGELSKTVKTSSKC